MPLSFEEKADRREMTPEQRHNQDIFRIAEATEHAADALERIAGRLFALVPPRNPMDE